MVKSGVLRHPIEHQHLLRHDFSSDPILALFILILTLNQPTLNGHFTPFREVLSHDFGELPPSNNIVPLGGFCLLSLGVSVYLVGRQSQIGLDLVPVKLNPFWILTETSDQQDAVAQCIHVL